MLVNSKFIIYNQVSMSIPNIIDKIKSKIDIDKITIMYLFVIIGVGISSFGLGRLSVMNDIIKNSNLSVIEADTSATKNNVIIINKDFSTESASKKMYVASKNGKMYYKIDCSGANRIKTENQIWFSSKTEAEKSGYTLSSTCK